MANGGHLVHYFRLLIRASQAPEGSGIMSGQTPWSLQQSACHQYILKCSSDILVPCFHVSCYPVVKATTQSWEVVLLFVFFFITAILALGSLFPVAFFFFFLLFSLSLASLCSNPWSTWLPG